MAFIGNTGFTVPDDEHCKHWAMVGLGVNGLGVGRRTRSELPNTDSMVRREIYYERLLDPDQRNLERIDHQGFQGPSAPLHVRLPTIKDWMQYFQYPDRIRDLNRAVQAETDFDTLAQWLSSDLFLAFNARLLSINTVDNEQVWCWNLATMRPEPIHKRTVCWAVSI